MLSSKPALPPPNVALSARGVQSSVDDATLPANQSFNGLVVDTKTNAEVIDGTPRGSYDHCLYGWWLQNLRFEPQGSRSHRDTFAPHHGTDFRGAFAGMTRTSHQAECPDQNQKSPHEQANFHGGHPVRRLKIK